MTIEELSSLAKLVSKYRPGQINILEPKGSDKGSKLYQMLLEGGTLSEQEIADELYKKPKPATFRKLKSRVEDKLMNMLFFMDLRNPKFSSSLKKITECYRKMAIYFILLRFSQDRLAIPLGEKLVNTALDNDLYEVAYPVLQTLRLHYSATSFNYKKAIKYEKAVNQTYQTLQYRHITEDLYCRMYALYAHSRQSHKEEIARMVEEALPTIDEIQDKSSSFFVQRRGYMIKVLYAQIIGNLDKSFKYCDEALNYFVNKSPVKSNVTILGYYIQKLALNLRIKNFINGKVEFQNGISLTTTYTRDWLVLHYLYFLLCLHSKEYEEAKKSYLEVTQDRRFKKVDTFFREVYAIFEAYIYILDVYLKNPNTLPFSANRYINNVPAYSKDKKGNNVSILIAHFILLCIQDSPEKAFDRIDALTQYTHRYLRDDETLRANCFIKMLTSVARADFHPLRAERYAQKPYEKLISTPAQLSEQSSEIEIIPYEDLWQILLNILDNKEHRSA